MSYFNTVNGGTGSTAQKLIVGPRLSVRRNAVFLLLKQLAAENRTYFEANQNKSAYYRRIGECCTEVEGDERHDRRLVSSEPPIHSLFCSELLIKIQEAAKRCDYDEKTPGNGFRSLVCVCDQVILHLISVLKKCSDTRGGLLFRSTTVCKDLENYVAILRFFVLSFQQVSSNRHDCSMPVCLEVVLLIDALDENSLFPKLTGDYTMYHGILKGIESLDASCFYGRSFGFQFTPTVTLIFNVIGIVLATYSLSWGNGASSAFGSLLNSGRYIMNPEERAKQIIKVTRESDIEFCRAFWNLSEIPPPKLFSPSMEIYQIVHVPMCGPLEMEAKDGQPILIPEPNAHGPAAPIQIRILSATGREGLSSKKSSKPLSSNLLLHCHGGGFVATSSKSHETYLRMWAKYLDCPIVSVDYSLSPEFPFPRPTEEVLYVYAWILKNSEKFGWDGRKILLVGDSAGGNLVVSVALRLAQLKAARMPDGLIPDLHALPVPIPAVALSCAQLHRPPPPHGHRDSLCCGVHGRHSERHRVGDRPPEQHQQSAQVAARVRGRDQGQESRQHERLQPPPRPPLNGQAMSMPLEEEKEDESAVPKKAKTDELMDAAEMEEEEQEERTDDDNATVHINRDSSHISLSTCNYEQTLINYLQSHPLTSEFVHQPSLLFILFAFSSAHVDSAAQFVEGRGFGRPNARRGVRGGRQQGTGDPEGGRREANEGVAGAPSFVEQDGRSNGDGGRPVGPRQRHPLHRARSGAHRTGGQGEAVAGSNQRVLRGRSSRSEGSGEGGVLAHRTPQTEPPARLPDFAHSCHLDPLLDDTIVFAKKLRDAGGRVVSLDLLDGLPHGFLNFAPVSADCYEGSKICMYRIKEAFDKE
ncbi:hypothetical protein M3Y99_00615300 [Aphelenchoides fujianensis]|nr:hypothetical protein M3Y99_00615300 [Aphelenchoides fujianensis]